MSGTRRGTGRAPALAPDLVVLGRYRLVDRVADTAGTSLWRGVDERLRRPVGVRFLPLDSALADQLRAGAAEASHVGDRHAVPVLDIDTDLVTERLVIVTEWLVGHAFGDLLASRGGDPMPPREAAALALEVARFLAAAHEAGVPHGRIRPNSVVLTDGGEVRVRGLGADRVLYGVDPGEDAVAADIHGAGAILYAALTGRWPTAEGADGLAAAPQVDRGRVPWPSRVVVDVPRSLDEVCARALLTSTAPKGLPRYASAAEVSAALGALVNPDPGVAAAAAAGHEPWRPWVRGASVAVFTAAAVGLGALGVALLTGLGSPPVSAPRAERPVATSTAPAPSGTPVTAPSGTTVIPVVSVRDYDPYGDDKSENRRLAPRAIDGKNSTAWTTVRYRAQDLSGKPGVGLLLDLGAPRPVSAVDVRLVGNGTDLSLLATDDPGAPFRTFQVMAELTGAGNQLSLRVPRPVTTRYVIVWLTALPPITGAYQGGVAEVRVLG